MQQALTSVRAQRHLFREEGGLERERKSGSGDSTKGHTSVMVHEVLDTLALKKGDIVLDATAGEGGTSEAILSHTKGITLIALDADKEAAAHTASRISHFKEKTHVVEGNFADLERIFSVTGVETVDKAVFDLGWNMGQLTSGRGFSFQTDEPLNMS